MSLDVGFVPTAFIDTITKNYFNFNGRTSRMGYWHYLLGYLVFAIIVALVASKLGQTGAMISNLISLALFLPAVGIGARRLHDIGKSGWWQLIMLVPLVGIIVLIVFFAKAGDAGANQFGEVPPAKAV
ncbi:MAG: DUF805 domain-containing protein [Alphaproteobacteria bacterium]